MERRRLAAVGCVVVLAIGACSPNTDRTPEPEGATGGPTSGLTPSPTQATVAVLRFAANAQGGGYPTPYAAVRGPGRLMTTFMFDSLAYPDVTGQPKPWLAKSWETSADGKSWTFHLNENAKWTDGQPLTADDIAFSFEYDLSGPGADTGVLQGVNYIDSVAAPDPATVVIQLTAVHPSFLSDITGPFGVAVIPKHIWGSVADPAHFQGDQAVIGSGPYLLKEFDQTTNSFDLVANNGFYLGRPVVQELQIVPVGDPLLALQQGDLDGAGTGNAAIPQSQFDTLSKTFELLTARGEFNEALFFNLAAGFPYDDVTFRQAVAYALNRQDMLDRLIGGRGVPGSAGGLGPANPFLNESLPDYAFDLAKAGTLLDQVDLKDKNGDGTRDLPDGSAFTIPLLTSASDSAQAGLLQEYLRAAGLTVEIKSVDQPTSDAADTAGDYKMAIVHFGGLSGDPTGLVSRFASTSKSKSFTRVFGYKNDAFDQLAQQQGTTLDPTARKDLVNQMQAIVSSDLPQLSLYVPDQVWFVNASKYGGWAYTPGCPPCGVALNKRMLVTGNAAPVPDN